MKWNLKIMADLIKITSGFKTFADMLSSKMSSDKNKSGRVEFSLTPYLTPLDVPPKKATLSRGSHCISDLTKPPPQSLTFSSQTSSQGFANLKTRPAGGDTGSRKKRWTFHFSFDNVWKATKAPHIGTTAGGRYLAFFTPRIQRQECFLTFKTAKSRISVMMIQSMHELSPHTTTHCNLQAAKETHRYLHHI